MFLGFKWILEVCNHLQSWSHTSPHESRNLTKSRKNIYDAFGIWFYVYWLFIELICHWPRSGLFWPCAKIVLLFVKFYFDFKNKYLQLIVGPVLWLQHIYNFSCEITALIADNCVLCCFSSNFTNKTNKMTKKKSFLSVLYVILLINFVISLLKQQSTQLPAMKAVISHEHF
jgi:hypothetical protein